MGHDGTNWELGFKQYSFHHAFQVLRVCNFSAFSLPPAFPPCSCPLAFRHQVRRLTSGRSSDFPSACVAIQHALSWRIRTIIRSIKLLNQPLKGVIRDMRGGARPSHDQPPLVEEQTEFAADNPPVIREAFPANLLGATAFAHGVD